MDNRRMRPIRRAPFPGLACLPILCALVAGCVAPGPETLLRQRLQYNEAVKTSAEEQLLLNIVRLRYTDTPSSLAVSAIAAQFERAQSAGLLPFFTASGADINRSFTAVLPQFGVQGADRPTFSLTPLDDQEFTRRLFTPLPLDGLVYLAKTTWPIATVFRLYLENLNWVPNAELASGPTPREPPPYADFLRGVEALNTLQRRGHVVFGTDRVDEPAGSPVPARSVRPTDVLAAAKEGLEWRRDPSGGTWTLYRKRQQPVLRIDPSALGSPEVAELVRTFRLRPGQTRYEITSEALSPFPTTYPDDGVVLLDLETRSLLQALYFVSHGIELPEPHVTQGLVTVTRDMQGRVFDWSQVTRGLFRVRSTPGDARPDGAHVAIPYRGHWFWIDATDQDTKSTFSLLVELSRLELNVKGGGGPLLTLPLGN